MTYNARLRRTRGSYYDSLLADQSASVDGLTLDELKDQDADLALSAVGSRLIVLDNPAPARGYALLVPAGEGTVLARIHVLDGQPDEAYRALFSHSMLQARHMVGDAELTFLADASQAAPHVRAAVERLGGDYGLSLHVIEAGQPETPEDAPERGENPEEAPEEPLTSNGPEIAAESAGEAEEQAAPEVEEVTLPESGETGDDEDEEIVEVSSDEEPPALG